MIELLAFFALVLVGDNTAVHPRQLRAAGHSMIEAIIREKAIKKWRRAWKLGLIERANPEWCDLFEHLAGA